MQFLITPTYEGIFYDYIPSIQKEFKLETREFCFKDSWKTKKGRNEKCYIIEINSLEDLIKLRKLCEEELIITDRELNDGTRLKTIEVYNGYRE